MTSNPAPDDVPLAFADRLAELKRRTPVRRPGQLEDASRPLQSLDAEAGPRRSTGFEILNEPRNRSLERTPLFVRQRGVVTVEARQPPVCRHGGLLAERGEERLAVLERAT